MIKNIGILFIKDILIGMMKSILKIKKIVKFELIKIDYFDV